MITSTIFFCIGLFIVLNSPQFELGSMKRPGSGFMPFFSGLLICGFAGLTFLYAFFNKSNRVEKIWATVQFRRLIFSVIMLVLYAILLESIGFIMDSFFLILLLCRYSGSQQWGKSILCAALSSIISYLLFEIFLKAQLPKGVLGF
ncbi:MAG: hypothetical protein A2X92_04375 [Syntrophus sp. GWC2_56_31]|nr:MAG: hypothetical protein A2X92_04375 [Syntrophus sp. GWC2_56_31]